MRIAIVLLAACGTSTPREAPARVADAPRDYGFSNGSLITLGHDLVEDDHVVATGPIERMSAGYGYVTWWDGTTLYRRIPNGTVESKPWSGITSLLATATGIAIVDDQVWLWDETPHTVHVDVIGKLECNRADRAWVYCNDFGTQELIRFRLDVRDDDRLVHATESFAADGERLVFERETRIFVMRIGERIIDEIGVRTVAPGALAIDRDRDVVYAGSDRFDGDWETILPEAPLRLDLVGDSLYWSTSEGIYRSDP